MTTPDVDATAHSGGGLKKSPTGVRGIDEITRGGLPLGRTTLVMGGPGTGKSLFATEFLVRGAEKFGAPGVLVALEQPREMIFTDARSVGFDLEALEREGLLAVRALPVEHRSLTESGDFTLDGLQAIIQRAVDEVGARRLAIDGVDAFFSIFENQVILREEFRRLSDWFSRMGLTVVLTASVSDSTGESHRLEEYLSDCVVVLNQRVVEQIGTRRLRIVKYRGTAHGTDEYPFTISDNGIRVYPITSTFLDHPAPKERISTGVADLDAMLGGEGYYRGSSVLLAGRPGAGKTTLAAHFATSVAKNGGRAVYFSFEESPDQLQRNMASVGLDLEKHVQDGSLQLLAARPSLRGLEEHLTSMQEAVESTSADAVIVDPITNLVAVGSDNEVKAMLTRLLDDFKSREVTVLLTSLVSGEEAFGTIVGISSLMDVLVELDEEDRDRQRHLTLSIRKARGINHSRQMFGFSFSGEGIQLTEPVQRRGAGGPS